jgi:PAS domain S-box-containing protein
MSFEYSPYIIPLAAAALISAIVAVYAWMHRSMRSAKALSVLALAVTIWAMGYCLEIAGADLQTKIFWGKSQYFGITAIPLSWLIFAYLHSAQGNWLTRRNVVLLSVIPVITLALAVTTEAHGLIWKDIHIEKTGQFSALGFTHGFWFWLYWVYANILLLLGTILIFRSMSRIKGLLRKQNIALLIAILSPWIGNLIYALGIGPIPFMDITPFGFTISVVAIAWGIIGFQLMDIAPIARDMVIEGMRDGMIVLDARGLIVDINPAAAYMIGVSVANTIGKDARTVLSLWPHLIERFRVVMEADEEITTGSGNAQRRFHVRLSPLMDSRGQMAGRVVMLRALGEGMTMPLPPRVRDESRSGTQPEVRAEADSSLTDQAPSQKNPIWDALVNFFTVPLKTDLLVPEDVNSFWHQTRERIFTIIARGLSVIGAVSLMLSAPDLLNVPLAFPVLAAILIFIGGLGLARNIRHEIRISALLFLLYSLGFVEAINFGFSVECFVFFTGFVVVSAVFTSQRGAMRALIIAILTLSAFAVLIGSKNFIPLSSSQDYASIFPPSVRAGLNSVVVFTASALMMTITIVMLIGNVQSAWEKEKQTFNLLQQERDLLDRRVTERTHALAEAEAKYRTLVEQLPLVVYRDAIDDSGTDNYISPQIEAMLGYPLDEWMQDPHFGQKIAHPDDQALDPNQTSMEYRLLARDGRIVWVRDDSVIVRDEAGRPLYVQGTLQDITERKQAEAQIRKLSEAAEQSANTIVITDVNGNIEYANPQFTKTTGYTLEEALGKNPRILKSGEQGHEFYEQLWKTITAGQAWRGEFRNKRKDGSLYWESATIAPILDTTGAIVNYVAVKEDITRQKEMEEALQRSNQTQSVLNSLLSLSLEEQTMEEMLERALDIILTIPWLPTLPKGGIFLVENQPGVLVLKTQRNLGAPLLAMCAQVPFGRCLCGRAAAEGCIQFADCVDERHENLYEGIQPHGHYNVPILSRDEVIGVLVLYIDAGRVRAPHEITFLEAVANTLAAMIRDKKADEALAIARDQALDASRFKSQLLSRVSHELRTPLSGVLGCAELLKINAYGEITERQREAVSQIIESTHYLTHMVNDLLDEAQIEAGTILLKNEAFSPTELATDVDATLSILAKNKGLSFNATISPDLPSELYGDVNRLRQVILNLAGNAIKFTDKGEVRIRIFRPTSTQWAIEISDTGAGIPKGAQESIFEPFRQLDNRITRENRGSGLGLSIVKQLVELMGGSIVLESETGKGSTFTVLLPINKDKGTK